MEKIDTILDEILAECEDMSPEELDARIESSLATPFGRMIMQMNTETLEAMESISCKK